MSYGGNAMNKLAALTPQAWNSLSKAIQHKRDLNRVMIELGEHFKVPADEAHFLLDYKRKQFPKTKLRIIDKNDVTKSPAYYPSINTVQTYDEPWSFLHEYGHAYEKADLGTKIKRLLPIKHKLNRKQQELLNNYIEEAYMTGNKESRRTGEFLKNVINDSQNQKEKDVWRLTEELRANARAFNDAKITGKNTAEKIQQPLAVSDIAYMGEYYPDELSKLLGMDKKPIAEKVRDINILKGIQDTLQKVRTGVLKEEEKIRT